MTYVFFMSFTFPCSPWESAAAAAAARLIFHYFFPPFPFGDPPFLDDSMTDLTAAGEAGKMFVLFLLLLLLPLLASSQQDTNMAAERLALPKHMVPCQCLDGFKRD